MDSVAIEDVGRTAGKVWDFLRAKGKTTLTSLERGVEAPKSIVDMAVGWLAREGKIEMRQEKRAIELWLTET